MAKRDVRSEVLGAVYAVCADVGLENLTTKRISEAANASEAMIYYHFKNKADILEKAFLNIHTQIDEQFKKTFMEQKLVLENDFQRVCFETWKVYYDFWRTHPAETDFYDSFIHSHYISTELWQRDNASYVFFMAVFGRLIADLAQKRGAGAFIFIWAMVIQSALTLAKRSIKSGEELTPETEAMISRLLGAMIA